MSSLKLIIISYVFCQRHDISPTMCIYTLLLYYMNHDLDMCVRARITFVFMMFSRSDLQVQFHQNMVLTLNACKCPNKW